MVDRGETQVDRTRTAGTRPAAGAPAARRRSGAPRTSRLAGGLAPAAVLALFGFWAGTFQGAASAAGAMVVQGVVLAAALAAASAWREPLALGRRGRLLTAALVLVVALATWSSPVSRAGWTAALLLPAWILLPAAVRRAWRGRTGRRLGLPAVSLVVLALSLTALAGRFLVGDARASMPLGHHNLTAVWLLALLPLAVLPLVGRDRGLATRLLAAAAGLAGLVALVATGSLSGALGLAVLVLLAAVAGAVTGGPWRRRIAALLGLVAVAVVAVAVPRLLAVMTGADPSTSARWTYWEAGLRGGLERPLLGWGPGAVPWTLADWLQPVPGVNPPYQVVGDLHSLPIHLFYELGSTGLLLAAAVVLLFLWRRLVALPGAAQRGGDPRLVGAGLLGLAGAGVACLAVAPLAVPAVPLALAVAAGAALAGEGMETLPGQSEPRGWWGPLAVGLPVLAYVLAAVWLLAPLDRAHFHYDRSRAGVGGALVETALDDLAEAVRLDPRFPLYRMHLARESAPTGMGREVRLGWSAAAAEALQAAEGAPGVGALWLSAGELALEAGEDWAPIALERACDLDPLGAAAPYLLARQVAGPTSVRPAARALLADPRLAAATYFEARRSLLEDAVDAAARWPGVAPGWGVALREAVAWPAGPPAADRPADVARLRVWADRTAEDSLALYAFRRSPRPVVLTSIPVRAARAAAVELPPATVLPETETRAFGERGCREGG